MKKRILALALACVLILGLAACGKDQGDPNEIVIGDYTAYYTRSEIVTDYDGDDTIAIYFDFTNNSDEAASFLWSMYYTVRQNGVDMEQSTVFLSEDSFDTLFDASMEDVAPGETLEVALTYKLSDKTTPIELKFSDLFDKEKDELTIDPAAIGQGQTAAPEEEAPSADGAPVVYKAFSMIAEGEELGEDMLSMMGDFYVVRNGDGTAVLDCFDEVMPVEDNGSAFTIGDMTFAEYTLDGDTMTVTVDGTDFVLTVTDEAYEVPAVEEESGFTGKGKGDDETSRGYAFGSDIVSAYSGDWHGVAEFYDCTGDYSDEDEMQCDIAARFVFDEDGYCTPYIRLCLSQPEEENFVIETMEYDEEYDCMLINGKLVGKQLDDYESFVEVDGEVLYIGATYDDGSGDVFNVLGCLRRLDDQWDYDNDYPYIAQEGVDYYMGMSFEERIELFGYDTSLIPEMGGNASAGGEGDMPEEPADDAPAGIVELQQLIDWKAWLKSVNSYENEYYKPTYAECVEAMGVEPAPRREAEWEDDCRYYQWTTADGVDHIIMTLKPTEDGSDWQYHAISWSGGVNG